MELEAPHAHLSQAAAEHDRHALGAAMDLDRQQLGPGKSNALFHDIVLASPTTSAGTVNVL
jgi:hypothetical protein